LLHSCHCVFYFVMMCALIFYLANRNHPMFKSHLNSNWFAIYRGVLKINRFFFSSSHLGPKAPSTLRQAQTSGACHAPILVQPAWPSFFWSCTHPRAGLFCWPISLAVGPPLSWSDRATGSRLEFITNSSSFSNGSYPLFDLILFFADLNLLRDKMSRSLSRLRLGIKSPINSRPDILNFVHNSQVHAKP
jgi:hypothetical protein